MPTEKMNIADTRLRIKITVLLQNYAALFCDARGRYGSRFRARKFTPVVA